MKRYFNIIFVCFLFMSCDLPENRDNLGDPMPAVWTIMSPDEPIKIYITQITPFDESISISDEYDFVSGAEITLSFGDSTVDFVQSVDTIYTDTYVEIPLYEPADTSFRVEHGMIYHIEGQTPLGDFEDDFIVPGNFNYDLFPNDTAVFDNSSENAFIVGIQPEDSINLAYEYQIFIDYFDGWGTELPESILYYGCHELRWLSAMMPDTVAIPWCSFYCEAKYVMKIFARNENLSNYIDYYYSDNEGSDEYREPPGGIGYVGVIGAIVEVYDTVYIRVE